MKHGSLFSGIGGFDLAAEWLGWDNVFHCEINEFGRKVLNYHFPKSISYEDITKTDFTVHRGNIDILSGGFPCQPFSMAGKRKGKEDERHLWPEMLRAIREIQPTYVVGENVFGLVNWNGGLVFDEVQTDLEAEGYEVGAYVLPACAINAPHRRDRVWFVAFKDTRRNGCPNGEHDKQVNKRNERELGAGGKERVFACEAIQNATNNERLQRGKKPGSIKESREEQNKQPTGLFQPTWQNFPTQPPICSGDDGIPTQLDGITFPKWRNESIKAYGNAIVPQVAYEIFKVINNLES